MIKRFVEWIVRTFYPDLIATEPSEPTLIDQTVRDLRFKTVQTLVDHAEETKSQGEYKHIYVLTAMISDARRNGLPVSTSDINFMIELALQIKKRGL